jgi:frataxin-like iron-binding protein CyaY
VVNSSDALLYPLADALCMELHEVGDRIRGMHTHAIKVGPWSLDTDTIVISDITTGSTASVFVKIVGDLWLYLVTYLDPTKPLTAYVINGGVVGLKVKDCTTIGSISVERTLQKLKAGVVTAYQFDEASKVWTENASALDLLKSAENALVIVPGSESVQ